MKHWLKRLLITKAEKNYQKQLGKKKISYHAWVEEQEANLMLDSAFYKEESLKDYIIFVQKNGSIHKNTPVIISKYFDENPKAIILYGDEDFLGRDGKRNQPWYKPIWSPNTYDAYFYLGGVVAVRKSFLKENNLQEFQDWIPFENCMDIKSKIDQYIRLVDGYGKNNQKIQRIPQILFHNNYEEISKSKWLERYEYENLKIVKSMSQRNACGEENKGQCFVSIIIPSKDNPNILKVCLDSLYENRKNIEIVIVDNGSSLENQRKIKKITDDIDMEIQYIYEDMEFNFSKMCNLGAKKAKANLLLFLNDDMELVGEEWLSYMIETATMPGVGGVGLKLYYPKSNKIQHAGIENLVAGPVHKLQTLEDDQFYYYGHNKFNRNCIAVTGACLCIEKSKFYEVGGFPEQLSVAYNDVAMGFDLYEKGYHNVVINQFFGFHHESYSRGEDISKEKKMRLARERKELYTLYPKLKSKDPYYPEHLNQEGVDVQIVPAYINSKNRKEKANFKEFNYREQRYRIDPCLMIRIELANEEILMGFGVVLGDNNACYKKYILLENTDSKCKNRYYSMKFKGQYRQDLEENMKDQKKVGLSGFWVILENATLPKGNYRIGMLAKHITSRTPIVNWSNSYFEY